MCVMEINAGSLWILKVCGIFQGYLRISKGLSEKLVVSAMDTSDIHESEALLFDDNDCVKEGKQIGERKRERKGGKEERRKGVKDDVCMFLFGSKNCRKNTSR